MSDKSAPSTPWTWCAWMGPRGSPATAPPMAPAGSPATATPTTPWPASARTGAPLALVTFFRDQAEIPSAEPPAAPPEARARGAPSPELLTYRSSGMLCFMAPDEEAAFPPGRAQPWVNISSLTPDEALLRWREVFPCATRVDPLKRLFARLPSPAERVRRIEADPRYRVLGDTASRLPRASPRRMARYKDLAAQPTTG